VLIEISHLTKLYGSNVALYDINLNLEEGRIIGLLGPNGSGKTTLIKIILGLLRQYVGEVRINGALQDDSTRSIISYLPDNNHIPIDWSIEYAFRFFSDFFIDFDSTKALELCKTLHLNPASKIKALSKGNKEKVSLILTLSRKAKLYILDEPIAGVDPLARERIFKLILEHYNRQSTILIATHLVHDVSLMLDEAIFLQQGRVILHKRLSEMVGNGRNLEEVFKESIDVKTTKI